MISEKLQKSRAFIEAECVKAASAQNLCRELKHVRIRRLFSKGTAGNWVPHSTVNTLLDPTSSTFR